MGKVTERELQVGYAKQVEDLIDIFDFFAVQDFMQKVDWQLAEYSSDSPTQFTIPDVEELKVRARDLLQQALDQKSEVSSAGFRAEYLDANLRLSFVVRDMEITPEGQPI